MIKSFPYKKLFQNGLVCKQYASEFLRYLGFKFDEILLRNDRVGMNAGLDSWKL